MVGRCQSLVFTLSELPPPPTFFAIFHIDAGPYRTPKQLQMRHLASVPVASGTYIPEECSNATIHMNSSSQ
ncbi:hypothetical protein VTO73DRAFT_12005 [Trametes versicolor]